MNKDKKAPSDREAKNLDPANEKISTEMRKTLVKFENYCTKMEKDVAITRRNIASTKTPRNAVTGQF